METLRRKRGQDGNTYFSYTAGKHVGGRGRKPESTSPGPKWRRTLKGLPNGPINIEAFIHSHPKGSSDQGEKDLTFSPDVVGGGDQTYMKEDRDISYYLVNPAGDLIVLRPNKDREQIILGGLPRHEDYGGDYTEDEKGYKGAFINYNNTEDVNSWEDVQPVAGIKLPKDYYDPYQYRPPGYDDPTPKFPIGNKKQCLGCYDVPPPWIKPPDIKTINIDKK